MKLVCKFKFESIQSAIMHTQQTQDESAAIPAGAAQALGRAMQAQGSKQSGRARNSRVNDTHTSSGMIKQVWQHPFVDVFKHFKVLPVSDWKQNKKQGDVTETFAKEIGRKAMVMTGSISANNYIQLPHPNSMTRSLGLTGRYLYLQVKMPVSSAPFSFHIDLQMAERTHGIRISASNLYKQVSTQNSFVLQIPLNVDVDRWTVVVFDLISLLKMSRLLPNSYIIEDSYQIKSLTLCANSIVRGVYTSDNEYDFVTLPPDLRFKFSFDINRWPEYFAWLELPNDIKGGATDQQLAEERARQLGAKYALKSQNKGARMADSTRQKMENEIDGLLTHQKIETADRGDVVQKVDQKATYDAVQAQLAAQFGPKSGYSGEDLMTADDMLGITDQRADEVKDGLNLKGLNPGSQYQSGMFCGVEVKRSHKLKVDPVMELTHIIGYSPSKCLSLKWSRYPNENIVVFSSCGSLIAMDVETNQQKRFFFGHSAPVCCFDIAPHGGLIASAQEGKNSIIRIWDYHTARCLQMLMMQVTTLTTLQCLSFSADGRFLASVGKDERNKERIIIWDISRVHKHEKPIIVAQQTSDYNITSLKFSPIDNFRLVSCGKENIRFWRIKETRNIRGSAVVLNQYARDTCFTTFDFDHAQRANMASGSSLNPDSRESEALRSVYVASKNGMVYQICYWTEKLLKTFRTNDQAIYSISVNETFIVTGSEDMYLRVWAMDFSEFYMEAKHEGPVCAVDISPDGRNIVCGTMNGSLGVLNKSNQRYTTLLRSHTKSILSMDYHQTRKNLITVSSDSTIRLWDLVNFDQVVEYSSPIEQALCVSAHPYLPLFACGFATGTMRVFDIEKTCVADNFTFTQFNKPIKAIAYSPNGDLLVTCCVDGGVALHNAKHQHLPTKMMNLEFAPEFVHVAFSPKITRTRINVLNRTQKLQDLGGAMDTDEHESTEKDPSEQESQEPSFQENPTTEFVDSLFAIMGEYGNNIMIYSSDSIILKHQIQVGQIVKSFQFSKNGKELIVVTKDLRVRTYSLARFEGIYLRELSTVHRGAITSTDLSENGGYMLTGGEDNLIKMWDYDAQKNVPAYYQAFIGHTFPVVKVLFKPDENNIVISTAENDGIYVWQFHGDTRSNYHPLEEEAVDQNTSTQVVDREALHEPTVLERMRRLVKEKKKPKLKEYSFIVSDFQPLETVDQGLSRMLKRIKAEEEENTIQSSYQTIKGEHGLTYNHFISMKDVISPQVKLEVDTLIQDESKAKLIDPSIVNGYDGLSGVHDNLIWNPASGHMVYTLHNKVIYENTKTRSQICYAVSDVRLSCIAQSPDSKLFAVGEGETNSNGQSYVLIVDLENGKVQNPLNFFQKGVQSIAFSSDGKFLIALGVQEEGSLVVYDMRTRLVFKRAIVNGHSANKIIMNPNVDLGVEFCTIGTKGAFTCWRIELGDDDYDADESRLDCCDVEVNDEQFQSDFVSAAFTPSISQYGCSMLMIGTADGGLFVYNPSKIEFIDDGKRKVLHEEIGHISCKNGQVVIGGSEGRIAKYSIMSGQLLPTGDPDDLTVLPNTYGGITAMQMDDKNEEGIIGTTQGYICYVNFAEKVVIPLVTKANSTMEPINHIVYDQINTQVFLTSTNKASGTVKMFTSATIDQISDFKEPDLGAIVFITYPPRNKKFRLVGHQDGYVKLIDVEKLGCDSFFKFTLEEGEKITCGTYSPCGKNIAVGTSFGSVFLCQMRSDITRGGKGHCLFAQKIERVTKTTENAVTSIAMSNFNPSGTLLVAFDNGHVRTWQSSISDDKRNALQVLKQSQGRKSKKSAMQFSFDDMGECLFDLIDEFDIFYNPHGKPDYSEEEAEQDKKNYCVSRFQWFNQYFPLLVQTTS